MAQRSVYKVPVIGHGGNYMSIKTLILDIRMSIKFLDTSKQIYGHLCGQVNTINEYWHSMINEWRVSDD